MLNLTKQIAADFIPKSKKARKLLKERAEHLAQKNIETKENKNAVNYIQFKLGEKELYGIPYQYTVEVMGHVPITKIPYVPSFILGAINRRGILIAVLDLQQLFYNKTLIHDKNAYIIIVNHHNITIGIIADRILGSEAYDLTTLDPSLPAVGVVKAEYILGLHQGLTAIINIEAVLQNPQMHIAKKVQV